MIRIFDLIFSLLALIIFLPLFIIVAIILRLTGEGEVIFLQNRVGIRNSNFKVIKFVTMKKDSENIGTKTLTVKNDPRILPLGRFLRKSKINELPQLINVLLGQMSLIGPRPQTESSFNKFPEESKEIISKLKPGLSGIGSIIFRDEEAILDEGKENLDFFSDIITPYKGDLEQWYFKNQNLKTYFLLIILTIWVIIFPNSSLLRSVFKDLPDIPEGLKTKIM